MGQWDTAVSCWVWAAQKEDKFSMCVCVLLAPVAQALGLVLTLCICVCVCEWVLGGFSMQHLGQRSAIDRKWSSGTATSAWQLIKWRDKNGKTWGKATCGLGVGVRGSVAMSLVKDERQQLCKSSQTMSVYSLLGPFTWTWPNRTDILWQVLNMIIQWMCLKCGALYPLCVNQVSLENKQQSSLVYFLICFWLLYICTQIYLVSQVLIYHRFFSPHQMRSSLKWKQWVTWLKSRFCLRQAERSCD